MITIVVAGRRGCGKTTLIRDSFLRLRPESDVYSLEFDRKRASHALSFAAFAALARAGETTYFVQILEVVVDTWTPQKLRASALCAPEIAKIAKARPETFGIVALQAEGEPDLPESAVLVLRRRKVQDSCREWEVAAGGPEGAETEPISAKIINSVLRARGAAAQWLLDLTPGERRLLTLCSGGLFEYALARTGPVTLFGQTAQELPEFPLLRLRGVPDAEKAKILRAEVPGRQFSQRAAFPATPRALTACVLLNGVVRARVRSDCTGENALTGDGENNFTPPRRLVVVESETAEPIALVAWVSGARPVAWGPLFRRAALFRSREVARVGGHGWSLGLIAERGRALGAAEAEICAFCDPERGTAVLVHGIAPGVVKTLSAPFQRVCAALRLGSALLHAFDVVLAPSARIDAYQLSGGVLEALRSAQLVLEEPCYVFEVSGDVSDL